MSSVRQRDEAAAQASELSWSCDPAWVVAPGYAPVAEAFARLVARRPTAGAAMTLYVGGVPVVDAWGGETYARDSLQVLFSVTKGITSIVVATLIEQGRLDVEAPVAGCWPEFAAEGKGEITVAQLLSHQAGLAAIREPAPLSAWADGTVAATLAAQAPLWPPGTAHGYHAVTFGVLADELVRRATGRSVSEQLAGLVAPLGAEVWIGLPAELERRVVPLIPPAAPEAHGTTELARLITDQLPVAGLRELANTREFRALELAAANGVGTARGLAALYAACVSDVGGTRLLSPETVARVSATRSQGIDLVGEEMARYGLGFQLPRPAGPMTGSGCFGHDGMGGALAFADPDRALAFAFVSDLMPEVGGADPETRELAALAALCTDHAAADGA